MPRGIFIVYSSCTEASRDEEFNQWYTHTHLPDLSEAKGLVKATRYRNLRPLQGPSQYLAIYEFESDDLETSVADLSRLAVEAFPKGRHIDCFGVSGMHLFEEIDPDSLEPLGKADYSKEPLKG
jgi:hypothetical protein